MAFYPFRNPETGEEYGSFETIHLSKYDYMWTDTDSCWFEIMCDHIDMEGEEEEVKKILGKVGESMQDGFDEELYLDEDEKEVYERIKKAPKKLEGWYWWPCFIGCLPESEPCGPFENEQKAIDDARRD